MMEHDLQPKQKSFPGITKGRERERASLCKVNVCELEKIGDNKVQINLEVITIGQNVVVVETRAIVIM